MGPVDELVARSNRLGADPRNTNYAGGNTSAKIRCPDPLTGAPVEVLWVKGSGGDLGTMKLDGFATLYLEKLRALERRYRGRGGRCVDQSVRGPLSYDTAVVEVVGEGRLR